MVNATSLYNIIYDNFSPKIDDEYLNSLESYMLTPKLADEINKSVDILGYPVETENSQIETQTMEQTSDILSDVREYINSGVETEAKKSVIETIIPETKNTLFWSIFIGNYGYDEYLAVGGKYLSREIAEKQKIVASFSENKRLKTSNHKITNVAMQEIIADLSVVKDEVYSNLVAYSIFYGKHIYFLMEHSYLEFYPTEEKAGKSEVDMKNTIVISMQPKTNRRQRIFGVSLNIGEDDLHDLLKTRIPLEHYRRPLRGVSSYKTDELDSMMNKIQSLADVKTGKMKKAEIYNYIAERIMLDYST